jgi:hypothetical protein
MKARSGPIAAFVIALMAAGCSNDGTLTGGGLNTSSIDQTAKSDPACLTLAKYKLKTEDLAKADELNKANTEFQTKCSAYPPRPVVATTTTPAMTTTTTTPAPAPKEKKVAAAKKTTPPLKPPAATAAAAPPSSDTTPAPQTAENPDSTLPQP